MARMVKLLRLSRVTRFIRAVPELIIIVKAMGFAARSVLVFFFVWLVIIYVYAVVLRQATDGSDVGIMLFPSVPDAMNSLLLDGLLADYAPFM
ncbi:DUSP9, partial [Symbiodinium necroappetens]